MEQGINSFSPIIKSYHVIQPIINVQENKVLGYEALLRSKEIKNPARLFQLARQKGQQFDLDMYSIFQACELLKQRVTGRYFYLNVFPSTLLHPKFSKCIERLLTSFNPSPGTIVFEISEAEKGTDLQALKTVVDHLRGKGFLIALDDVGEGESNLKTIFEIEPDFVKIDRYFSMNLASSPKKKKLLRLLVKLFSSDTCIILEGIETKEDLFAVKALGVPYVQGFYTGRPEPVSYYFGSGEMDSTASANESAITMAEVASGTSVI